MAPLAFLGGTGPEGRGLALRYALVGQEVLIGSRDAARAAQAAERVRAKARGAKVTGVANSEAARLGESVFLVAPYEAQRSLLEEVGARLAGKLVVSVVSPVVFAGGRPKTIAVEEGSAALQAQRLLPDSQVVAAFHHVSATDLWATERRLEGDVLVCADDADAKSRAMELVRLVVALRPVDAGGLENARYVEEFTALLMELNRLHRAHTSVRILGV
ncbi:MAG: NADPH-dependent F420 reductase [Chloroflexota bacterium]|nr:NADPH-dependent F420 reductase [Chloroflexota bacterium]